MSRRIKIKDLQPGDYVIEWDTDLESETIMRDIYASHDYDPQPCDYCGTVWDTEAQAWGCSHNDRMETLDIAEDRTSAVLTD